MLGEASYGDRHSAHIVRVRAGLLRGVDAKHAEGVINDVQRDELIDEINRAEPKDFKPLVYVVPVVPALYPLIQRVTAKLKASTLSQEVIIQKLPRDLFEPIDLEEAIS
jgi:hypothetical protein